MEHPGRWGTPAVALYIWIHGASCKWRCLQKRIDQKKEYTLAAIDVAVANGLLAWDIERGKLYARTRNMSPGRGCRPKGDMDSIGNKAGLLGMWFSEHDIGTIASYMGVAF